MSAFGIQAENKSFTRLINHREMANWREVSNFDPPPKRSKKPTRMDGGCSGIGMQVSGRKRASNGRGKVDK